MSKVYDKHGREIMVGDVLRVFHFIAAVRREKCYMYKQVVGIVVRGNPPVPFLEISHLEIPKSESYLVMLDGHCLPDYEIIQGYGPDGVHFKDRPRSKEKVKDNHCATYR